MYGITCLLLPTHFYHPTYPPLTESDIGEAGKVSEISAALAYNLYSESGIHAPRHQRATASWLFKISISQNTKYVIVPSFLQIRSQCNYLWHNLGMLPWTHRHLVTVTVSIGHPQASTSFQEVTTLNWITWSHIVFYIYITDNQSDALVS